AEEQIALQRHALNLASMGGKERQLVGTAVERGAELRTIEAEFDRVDAADAQGERRAADDDPDQNAGDEAPIDDEEGDRDQRQISRHRKLPRRAYQPLIEQARAEK